ncbi:MAG: glycosyltransferase family 2 protein [Mariniphaga sp.]|nr:glycosyltransferase family 2 protein [Mariniphaga sp.]
MKVCGFSFVKNAVKFDYPIVEAITSILPVCDKFIVAVGDCNDGSRELIESIDSDKIEIIDTVWDPSLRERGRVLASETNKAFDFIPAEYDWCFYIQGDEVVHEKYLPGIVLSMKKYLHVKAVDGLIMHYTHLYGTFDYYADSRGWYRSEIRIIRNNKEIRSWNDAQGFRWKNAKKLTGVFIDAFMYHYGWVRPPKLMMNKLEGSKQYWSANSKHIKSIKLESEEFKYEEGIDSLQQFTGTHPKVMQPRIDALNWHPKLSTKKKKFNVRYFVLYYFEKLFKYRPFENKHFIQYKES